MKNSTTVKNTYECKDCLQKNKKEIIENLKVTEF